MTEPVARDERTLSIENASYRWAYLLMTYGLLAAVAYRAFTLQQSSWDLMALVVAGGLVAAGYQGLNRVLSRRWALITVATALAAAAVAAGVMTLGLK